MFLSLRSSNISWSSGAPARPPELGALLFQVAPIRRAQHRSDRWPVVLVLKSPQSASQPYGRGASAAWSRLRTPPIRSALVRSMQPHAPRVSSIVCRLRSQRQTIVLVKHTSAARTLSLSWHLSIILFGSVFLAGDFSCTASGRDLHGSFLQDLFVVGWATKVQFSSRGVTRGDFLILRRPAV